MGKFLHGREYLHDSDVVVIDCDTQCNFMLVDDSNFSAYRRGVAYTYYGGHFKRFPGRIVVPHSGNWNWILDLAGGSANIRYSVTYIKNT